MLRRHGRTRWLVLPSGTLLALVACASCIEEPFVGTVSRSKYFEYHDEVKEPLCPTLLSLLDQHAERIGAKIGAAPDPADPYRFYKFRDLAALEAKSPCGPERVGGCASGGSLFSPEYFHGHEQVHAYVYGAWGGRATGLIEEGIAVALSCSPFIELGPTGWPVNGEGPFDWRELLYISGDTNAGYSAAGYFVTYLAGRYGWQSVADLRRRAPVGITAVDFERAFAQVFPIPMDQAWDEALHAPGATPCQMEWLCGAQPMKSGEHATRDCDGELHRSLVVTDQAGVVLSLGAQVQPVMLIDCTDSASPWYELVGGYGKTSRATHWASLPPGTYSIPRGPSAVELRSFLSTPLLGSTCDAAGTVSLDPAEQTYIDFRRGKVDGWIHLSGGGHTYDVSLYNLFWTNVVSTAGAPVLCDDCSPTAACVPLAYGQLTRVTIPDHAVVRMQNIVSSPVPPKWGQLMFYPAQASDAGL